MKSKTTAGILGIIFGEIGAHWFYLGKPGKGALYLCCFLLTFWTVWVPIVQAVIVLVEGLMLLNMDDAKFDSEYNVALGSSVSTLSDKMYIKQETPTTSPNNTSKMESLLELKKLLDSGILTQEEFDDEKKKILNS